MPSSSEHQHPGVDGHPLGSHMLGPHVVGLRVVVRRVLDGQTGPTGGPAFTDVLGVCRSWDTDSCEVEREDGSVVTVAVRDIVSGKPIPPRPPVRHRVGVREAELHTASLWSDLHTEPLGQWQLRAQPGPVARAPKRANSCLALGDPGVGLADALTAVRTFYAQRQRRALVHTEVEGEVEAALADLGWREVSGGRADLMLGSVSRALRAGRRAAGVVDSSGPPGLVVHTHSPDPTHAVARVGEPGGAAHGEAALDGDWLGLHSLHVEPARRRRGIARAVVAELLEWGAERGATTAWLHVETDNLAARGLYEGLGLAVHHRMTYLAAPD